MSCEYSWNAIMRFADYVCMAVFSVGCDRTASGNVQPVVSGLVSTQLDDVRATGTSVGNVHQCDGADNHIVHRGALHRHLPSVQVCDVPANATTSVLFSVHCLVVRINYRPDGVVLKITHSVGRHRRAWTKKRRRRRPYHFHFAYVVCFFLGLQTAHNVQPVASDQVYYGHLGDGLLPGDAAGDPVWRGGGRLRRHRVHGKNTEWGVRGKFIVVGWRSWLLNDMFFHAFEMVGNYFETHLCR